MGGSGSETYLCCTFDDLYRDITGIYVWLQ